MSADTLTDTLTRICIIMKIIASDYDGTLYANNRLLGDVSAAVSAWRASGNKFGIATGRDFAMSLPEIERWNIEVDFLVCINGAAVYDQDFSLMASQLIDDEVVPRILNHPAGLASEHYQLSGLGPLRVLLREGSFFKNFNIPFTSIDMEEALSAREIGQISLSYPTVEESTKWTQALNSEFGAHVCAHQNKRMLDVTRRGVDKAAGIASLLRGKGWLGAEVHTIGDGDNDSDMLERYIGHTVPNAAPSAVSAARDRFENVPAFIDSLLRS